MIVVTVQYRLGIFGFLSLNSKTEKLGNFGLYDQQMAIKFIHRNAKNIGGNSSLITIAGIEAGGQSVGHLVNSESRALIGGAISMLGVGNFPYFKPNVKTLDQKFRSICTKTLNVDTCETESMRDFLTSFESVPTSTILSIGKLINAAFLPRSDESFFVKNQPNNSISYMIVTTSTDGPVVKPEYRGNGHSLCSIYDRKFLNLLRV